jgi:DNA-binding Lrp family transcriptional regulator
MWEDDVLDELDFALIARLQENARRPVTQLAKELKRPTATVRDRLRRLEDSGVIQGYTAVIDTTKVDLLVKALVHVSTSGQAVDPDEFLRAVGQIPQVTSANLVTGDYEAVLTVYVRDVQHLAQVLYQDLRRVPGVTGTTTSIVLLGREWNVPRPEAVGPL